MKKGKVDGKFRVNFGVEFIFFFCYDIIMKPTVYIETSVVSYLTAKLSKDLGIITPGICTPEELMEVFNE